MEAPWVAIVEDEKPVRKALGRLLCAAGVPAGGFATCAAFLHSVSEARPDCMILDLHMPGMSGLELLHELDARNLHIPTIVITAHDEPGMRERCLGAGAVAYLLKPLDDGTLFDAMALALGHEFSRPALARQNAP